MSKHFNRKLISPNSTHPQSSNLKAMFTGEMLRAKAREEKASKLKTDQGLQCGRLLLLYFLLQQTLAR